MNGIIPLWKPKGLTSHDCVMKIRRLLKTKKVGHTGTLDPEVEGLLPICVGQATKIVPYLTDTKKHYIAEVAIGIATDTEDSHGNVVATKTPTKTFSVEEVDTVLRMFTGDIVQIPPMYSAVKVNGKKLYEYAREGKFVERPKRVVKIDDIKLLSGEVTKKEDTGVQTFSISVKCSKGTYIRTLCVDIGKALGYPAHMSHLVRTETGSFDQSQACTFEDIELAITETRLNDILLPLERGIDHLDVYQVDASLASKIADGQKLKEPESMPNTNPFRVQYGNQLLAIYQRHPEKSGEIKPVRVFHTTDEK